MRFGENLFEILPPSKPTFWLDALTCISRCCTSDALWRKNLMHRKKFLFSYRNHGEKRASYHLMLMRSWEVVISTHAGNCEAINHSRNFHIKEISENSFNICKGHKVMFFCFWVRCADSLARTAALSMSHRWWISSFLQQRRSLLQVNEGKSFMVLSVIWYVVCGLIISSKLSY